MPPALLAAAGAADPAESTALVTNDAVVLGICLMAKAVSDECYTYERVADPAAAESERTEQPQAVTINAEQLGIIVGGLILAVLIVGAFAAYTIRKLESDAYKQGGDVIVKVLMTAVTMLQQMTFFKGFD